jgi:hypothetical protein
MNKNLIHLFKKKFQKMVIEILVINDIQFFFCSNDFKFEINVIMYIIEIFYKINSNHFI